MSFITASLARQSAIARANQAEMDAIRASQAQQEGLPLQARYDEDGWSPS